MSGNKIKKHQYLNKRSRSITADNPQVKKLEDFVEVDLKEQDAEYEVEQIELGNTSGYSAEPQTIVRK